MMLNGSNCFPAILLRVCCSSVALREKTNKTAAEIVHIQFDPNTIFFNLMIWTWSSPLSYCISDFNNLKLAFDQSHSAWQLLTLNSKLNSCNVTHSGVKVGLQLGRILGLMLPDWIRTWTGQVQPPEARLRLQCHFASEIQVCAALQWQRWCSSAVDLQWYNAGIGTVALLNRPAVSSGMGWPSTSWSCLNMLFNIC